VSREGRIVALLIVIAVTIVAGWRLLAPRQPAEHAPPSVRPTRRARVPQPVPSSRPQPSVLPTTAPVPAKSRQPSVTENAHGARLALIVDDCGQWLQTERAFIALPIPLTLSILPGVRYTSLIATEAAQAGKGVMLHLPMEPVSHLDPGPGKITTEMSDQQIDARVRSDLAQVPLARGVNNHEGSKATADMRVMRDVASVLVEHGKLFFVDSRTGADSVAAQAARAAGLPAASRDVFLDDRENVAYTEGQLREAAEIARRTGSAIAIGHPRETTLEAVRAMIPQLQADGIRFVLVQDLFTARGPQ
jgi:polysaccharide deacetylase 2 family uncharacterized protein YibQ